METINIEKIMQDIRTEIKEKGYTSDMLSFRDITVKEGDLTVNRFNKVIFNESIDFINKGWKVQAYRMLYSNGSVKSKISTFVKKVIRKCTKFYVEPITEDQDSFNAATVRLFNLMQCYIDEKQVQINKLLAEQEALRQEILELKQSMQQK